METVWSRPFWKDHHHNHVTGLRLFGDRAGAAQAVDTVRNSRRVGSAAGRGGIERSCTRDSPPVPPSVMPEALKSSECECGMRTSARSRRRRSTFVTEYWHPQAEAPGRHAASGGTWNVLLIWHSPPRRSRRLDLWVSHFGQHV